MTLENPSGGSVSPLFADPEQCRAWRDKLPLSNPVQSQVQLLNQLNLLNRHPVAGEQRLAMLEILREPILFVQEESAKKYSGKPLPLAPPEQAALDSVHSLWQALVTGYLLCLDDCLADGAALRPQLARVSQRALAVLADDHADLVRGGREPDATQWRRAHLLYASAEEAGVAASPVAEDQRGSQPVTPATAYAELMLLSVAGLHEFSPRQQVWVIRWARRFAGKLKVLAAPPPLDAGALPLCADLGSESPASHKPSGEKMRWLDTGELRKSLKARINRLARGEPDDTPAKLGLGDDCAQPACGEALRRIYPRWVKGGILRRHERKAASGACRFVAGVDATHYYIAGRKAFKPPGSVSSDELRRQQEEIATFGRVANRHLEDYSRNHGFQVENWEMVEDWGVLNQSSGGVRVARPLTQAGGRLGVGQLVAVQPAGATGMRLGMVRWVQVVDATLSAGIQVFPGAPFPVMVRGTGVMAAKETYRPGFVLPAGPDQAASLVLPPGSFKPNRITEAWTPEASQQFKLKALVERGADFELAAGEEMPPR